MDFVILNLALLLVVFSDSAARMGVKGLSALAANLYFFFLFLFFFQNIMSG